MEAPQHKDSIKASLFGINRDHFNESVLNLALSTGRESLNFSSHAAAGLREISD